MTLLTTRPRLLVALLASSLVGAFCPKEAKQPLVLPEPAEKLAQISAELSEPGGYFDSDNLISNETSYLQVADALAELVPPGGVYIGVGPDQNFSYIARLRPKWAFILDIRRGNMLQHLLFDAVLAVADDPYQYLCQLFSRPCPATTPPGAVPGIDNTLRALASVAPTEDAFTGNLAAFTAYIEGPLGFTLSPQDKSDLRTIYRAFYDEQVDIRFKSFRRPWALYHPTYKTLLLARSPSNKHGNFLDTREDYTVVRDLARAQRIVPVVGDFAGPKALRAIAERLRRRQETVSVFYTSNVEFYLLRNDALVRFVENVGQLPLRPDSLLIRACFDYGRSHPAELPGHRSATVLQKIPRFLELHVSGALTSYWDVCTLDYLR